MADSRRKKLDDKSEVMILVGYHKTGACRLFNLIREKNIISRDIIIDENEAWNWTSNNTSSKPLLNSELEEESKEEEDDILADLHEDVLVVIHRPQRNGILQARLQDYEVIAENEVIEDGDLVHFVLKNEALINAMVKELTTIERNRAW